MAADEGDQPARPGRNRDRGVAAVEPGGASVTEAGERRLRILIVDDEPMLLEMLGQIVGQRHDVTLAASGQQALALLDDGERFDAIVCDLMMPRVSGIDLHAQVARLAPGMEARIVFVTGGGFTDEAKGFLRSVPNPRLEKPFDVDELVAMIDEVADGPSRPA